MKIPFEIKYRILLRRNNTKRLRELLFWTVGDTVPPGWEKSLRENVNLIIEERKEKIVPITFSCKKMLQEIKANYK